MSKKLIFIILGIVALLCFCCLCCVSIFFVAGKAADKEISAVAEDVIYPLCMTEGYLSYSEYNNYFDSNSIGISEAEAVTEEVFGDYDNCSDFKGKNIFSRLAGGHSFEINSTTEDGTTATYSFEANGTNYSFYLSKEAGEWLITDID